MSGRTIGNILGLVLFGGLLTLLGGDSTEDLKVGDCFDDPSNLEDGSAEVISVDTKECIKPHDNEVFALHEMDGSTWYGRDFVERVAEEACLEQFESYVNRRYETSRLAIGWIAPTEESWRQNNQRTITCFLYNMDYAKLTGSMRNSGE